MQADLRFDGRTHALVPFSGQCSSFTKLCLGSIKLDCVIDESCYKGQGAILQRNNRKMTIVNFYGKRIWEPQHSVLPVHVYPNPCYKEVCKTGLHCIYNSFQITYLLCLNPGIHLMSKK